MKSKKVETYTHNDLIIPILNLHKQKEVEIGIDITKDEVSLQIGPRDWQWDRKTGELIGCGTMTG